ncbi:MAG: hypothetical protein ABIJ35_13365, partial [Acidobacteriota bacterium]
MIKVVRYNQSTFPLVCKRNREMKLFSERTGIKPLKQIIQVDGIDTDLRNKLWSALYGCYWVRVYPLS